MKDDDDDEEKEEEYAATLTAQSLNALAGLFEKNGK